MVENIKILSIPCKLYYPTVSKNYYRATFYENDMNKKRRRREKKGDTRDAVICKVYEYFDYHVTSDAENAMKLETVINNWYDSRYETYTQGTRVIYSRMKRIVISDIGKTNITNHNENSLHKYINHFTSPSNRLQCYNLLSNVFEYALSKKLILRNPVKTIPKPKVENKEAEIMSYAQLRIFTSDDMDTSDESKRGICYMRYARMFKCCFYFGTRISECTGLTWDCVDFKHNRIYIHQQLMKDKDHNYYIEPRTKTYKKRVIYVSQKVMGYLKEEKALQDKKINPNPLNLVFTNYDNSPISSSQARYHFTKIAKLLGNPNLTPHSLRHTIASLMYARSTDLLDVSRYLGHNDYHTTLRYIHAFKEDISEDIEKMALEIEELIDGTYKRNNPSKGFNIMPFYDEDL